MNRNLLLSAMVGAVAFGHASLAEAALVNLGPGSFTPAASVITFSEFPVGTTNPTYVLGGNTITFGDHFIGQTVTSGFPATLTGSPTGGSLSLVQANTFITSDSANPSSPVLSGTPVFNGPISIHFSTPVAAVGLDGGFFDAIGGTTIQAFDSTGASLGTITNSMFGIEFYGLFDSSGSNIAGISFYITGAEPAGFAIDNVTFGNADVVVPTPEPAAFAVLGMALLGLGITRRRG
jgi:hypothetical protein